MADKAIGGLPSYLETERIRGISFRAIATKIQVNHDLPVSGDLVRDWARRLGIQ